MKALVIFMGVLIILGTALVIGVVVHRLTAGGGAASVPVGVAVPAAAALAPGERVNAIVAAGSGLGVWVSGPAGDRVLLVDPASGRVSEALRSVPAAAK